MVFPATVCPTLQLVEPSLLFFTTYISGAEDKPWPTVVSDPVPVQVTILKPAVGFAETVDAVLPFELDVVPFAANQFHAT